MRVLPYEAVQTNITGAENIVRAIHELGLPVDTVVGISTDKACKPVNVMGMTKALQERLFVRANLGSPAPASSACVTATSSPRAARSIPLSATRSRMEVRSRSPTTEMTRFLLSLERAVDTLFAALRAPRRNLYPARSARHG